MFGITQGHSPAEVYCVSSLVSGCCVDYTVEEQIIINEVLYHLAELHSLRTLYALKASLQRGGHSQRGGFEVRRVSVLEQKQESGAHVAFLFASIKWRARAVTTIGTMEASFAFGGFCLTMVNN